ncbi:MAG TPA: phosphoesterase RecJ domain-containing protein [Clostridiales bacterium]|nr:phosphoesterase RecJ domain-containing protein [Clostridiales bacterium]
MNLQQTAQFLRSHDNYLVVTHKRPDGDAIGSSVGLLELLRAMGKTAWLLDSQDATQVFQPYLDGRTAPEGFAPDTVVSVDLAALGLLPANGAWLKGRIDLAIDHHGSQEFFAQNTWLEADAAACGEMIYALSQELGVSTPAARRAIYLAVATDTGCFLYGNTTGNTHRVAAALIDQGVEFQEINKRHFRTKSMARLKLESLMVQEMRLYHHNTVAIVPLSLAMMAQCGAGKNDTEDISAFIGQLEGVRHSATVREMEDGQCKISLRTQADLLDASATCARLGGGGHKAASGCTVTGSVDQACQAILAAIEAQMAEEGHG